MKKLFTLNVNMAIALIIFLSIFLFDQSAFCESFTPDASGGYSYASHILIDAKTGLILSEKNSHQSLSPASTTKIMTSILALEYGDLNRRFIASYSAVEDIGRDGMNISIVPGEELRLEDLLNALLIRSANETANIIAENISPSRKDFIDLMNRKALELGATDTKFVNTNGKDTDLSDAEHHSTAADMSKFARYALTFKKFREIVVKKLCKIPITNKLDKERYLGSTNKLLYPAYKSTFYSQITGVKTGYTEKAGNNLVSSAIDKDGNELICVVMGVRNGNVFNLSKQLLEFGFKNFSVVKIEENNTFVQSITLPNYSNTKVDLYTQEDANALFPIENSDLKWEISKTRHINTDIKLPIKKGEILGYVDYSINNTPVAKVSLISSLEIPLSSVETNSSSIDSPVKKVIKFVSYLLLLAIIAAIIIIVSRRYLPLIQRRYSFGKCFKFCKKSIEHNGSHKSHNKSKEPKSHRNHRSRHYKSYKH